ncbi:MAG: tRNA uridine-5-carboxymethylaminomethyl(34) synthesis enzyme MnmG [Lachnospiraceae bacterium]|nr:tRNA uridine-5-carboxymethylaminomethyl(34) synthesis enzyme MnmG [Lachnospiraceae bacterium]
MTYIEENYDIVVVGAGHAGCEAALAAARMGLSVILFTVSMDSVAMMPCNPSIGGSSKGHLVREVDALGGEMGKNIDKTFLQSKMLNRSKGPAVHSLRAQADKQMYSLEMRKTLQSTDNLTLRQAEVSEILVEDKKIIGVKTFSGAAYFAKAVVLCTGTYLNARCLYGDVIEHTGPNGLKAANHLTDSLIANGIKMQRFKTGTPARIDKRSMDFSKMVEQNGDERIVPFSFTTDPDSIQKEQVKCYLTYTNEMTHEIIRKHLDESPIYAGIIEGTGPRYCPSIEDKVVKFADKDRHQLFIEPEGLSTNEMYISGMSSSMPEFVQHQMYRTVAGLENAKIVRNAYAIEYDCIEANQLLPTLEFKAISGLFAGGQFNGSSGYEEAAAQGIIAGINAALSVKGEEQIVIDRSQGYIGVLIDDLVTKENREPYRMMTSRAEYRLLLRQDNADLRLTPVGYRVGLIDEDRYQKLLKKQEQIQNEIDRIKKIILGANEEVNTILDALGSARLDTGVSLSDLMKRPELSYELLSELDGNRPPLPEDVKEQVNIQIKYEGYIERQEKQVERFKKLERKNIPSGINYDDVSSLRLEARQKLSQLRPLNIGQASRISGVSPADISVLLVYLESYDYSEE